MAEQQVTAAQRQATDLLVAQLQRYLDARYPTVSRLNPAIERSWEDLTTGEMMHIRLILNGTKAFGPVRHHVAETLIGDDEKKIRELIGLTTQNSIFPEVVEASSDKDEKHGSQRRIEIHDMRTLYKTIEPALQNAVSLVQTFLWFDFEDAIDLTRAEVKMARIAQYAQGGLNDPVRAWYREAMKRPEPPTDEDIIVHELVLTRKSVEAFCGRRDGEDGYKRILARDPAPGESVETLAPAFAYQLNVCTRLRTGQTLDETLTAQFAQAMACEANQVTPERALAFAEKMVAETRRRLRAALNGTSPGVPYNFKERQAQELRAKFEQARAGRTLPEIVVAAPTKPAGEAAK